MATIIGSEQSVSEVGHPEGSGPIGSKVGHLYRESVFCIEIRPPGSGVGHLDRRWATGIESGPPGTQGGHRDRKWTTCFVPDRSVSRVGDLDQNWVTRIGNGPSDEEWASWVECGPPVS
ncbi:hypothetical protein QAD02_007788 [Eretmocerus hayati]|nr:hypothetical protein QAD02_007788 [Eretmocerus hayati]